MPHMVSEPPRSSEAIPGCCRQHLYQMTSPGLRLGKTEQLPDAPFLVLHCIFTIFVVPWYGPLPLGLLSMTPELGCLVCWGVCKPYLSLVVASSMQRCEI